MTFNNKNNKVFYSETNGNLNKPLLVRDEEANKLVGDLNSLVFDFEKSFEKLKDYHKKLSSMTEKEFS